MIKYYNGATWTNLATLTSSDANQLKTYTIPALSSSDFTIRFVGATESGDTTQSSWQIDCVYLSAA